MTIFPSRMLSKYSEYTDILIIKMIVTGAQKIGCIVTDHQLVPVITLFYKIQILAINHKFGRKGETTEWQFSLALKNNLTLFIYTQG